MYEHHLWSKTARNLGANSTVGAMTLLLSVRGNLATRSRSGPPCSLQFHCTTLWCGATFSVKENLVPGPSKCQMNLISELTVCGRVGKKDVYHSSSPAADKTITKLRRPNAGGEPPPEA
jgi:hypothetical protein